MRVMKAILATIIFVFIAINATALESEELPEGWRLPSENDLKPPTSPDSINFTPEFKINYPV